MLEFLLYALFSQSVNSAFPKEPRVLPKVEILEPAPVPRLQQKEVAPKLIEDPRTAVLAIDLGSGKTLLDSRSNRPQAIASLTKLMTTLIILEEHEMNEVVTVSLEATKAEGSRIDIYEYERLTVRTLLEAILIGSANDAAVALAVHNAGSEASFVEKMNEKAKTWGLDSAIFYNSTGLDIYPKKEELTTPKANTMSAYDVSRLAQRAWKNPFIKQTVGQSVFSGSSVDEAFYHEKNTTNELLSVDFLNMKGLKTGYTQIAGQCFISVGENQQGNEILTVILGSEDRFGETKNLLSWIYDAYQWE